MTFIYLSEVIELNIKNCIGKNITNEGFKYLKNIQILNMEGLSYRPDFTYEIFKYLKTLKKLDISFGNLFSDNRYKNKI